MRTNKYLQLINREFPIIQAANMQEFVPAPYAKEHVLIHASVAQQLTKLITAIDATEQIVVLDGYRTEEMQSALWQQSLLEHGEQFTRKYVALPGCSEHQSGLAIDIGLADAEHHPICPNFDKGAVVARFLSQMKYYGFILRYPKNKEELTGIAYEPWHFRFVGLPHSEIIMNQGWVLEEYLEYLKEVSK
ncbi:D,D-carboxypeptidase/D,D-dipeptidase VanXY [Enterococcus saccharolyticus]|uniref:D-alanyl-D-alanine carboxypeptidase-like core domain-containing protein n=1 Tax=Candidatus Enterococcus willemsii TaxID=1857215 RepID=A0ABQ6YYC5_9ENTE|nr:MULTISPECIES: D,D-carboxypeptidase/D,D-dipeptidase VanXY [Enterococcus]KAF1302536.1 hypothetical protein BAU17_02270 [Enterococcus sp. CU12B]MCD5002996.1 D,D-carboxypeptidase/D,D-dipeptidase VanXY [Enterococcus saccharolyticus]